ncbi:cystatin [Bombina bombina]|uniref:cystatin n=1 Tax=Bombina bombina TaxID=8345 RepID=UPI00235AE5C2|nr:cystatin [Bombina bombina]
MARCVLFALLVLVCCLPGGAPIPGGWGSVPANSDSLQEPLSVFIQNYNKATNDVYVYRVQSVVSAQSQVVAGVNYKITAILGKTTCRKNKYSDVNKCPFASGNKLKKIKCTFVVYIVAWTGVKEVTQQKCVKA